MASALILVGPKTLLETYATIPDKIHPTPGIEVLAPDIGWSGYGRKLVPLIDINPDFNSATQVKTGPVINVQATEVTRTWSVRDKTAQELSNDKDAIVAELDSPVYPVSFIGLLLVMNEVRAAKSRINDIITATGAAVTPFSAGEIATLDETGLKSLIRTALG